MKSSGLLQIAVFALAGIPLLGFVAAYPRGRLSFGLGLGVIIATVLFIVWAFGLILSLLLDPAKQQRAAEDLMRGDLAAMMRDMVYLRLARSRLDSLLKGMKALIWPMDIDEGQYFIVPVVGARGEAQVVADVDLHLLDRVIRQCGESVPLSPPDGTDTAAIPAESRDDDAPASVLFSRGIGQTISPARPLTVGFRRTAFELGQGAASSLGAELARAFTLEESEIDDRPKQRLQAQLAELRSLILRSLQGRLARDAEEKLDTYAGVVRAFFGERRAYSQFANDAPGFAYGFSDEFNAMPWLHEDIRDFILTAKNAGDEETLAAVLIFLYRLASHAVTGEQRTSVDSVAFSYMVRYLQEIYASSATLSQPDHNVLVDRQALFMAQLGGFVVEAIFQQRDGVNLAEYARCLTALLEAFNNTLKSAFDQGREHDFDTLAGALDGVIENLNIRRGRYIGMRRRDYAADSSEPIDQVLEGTVVNRNLIHLGLDAWIVGRLDGGLIDRESFLRWRSYLPALPEGATDLWQLHVKGLHRLEQPQNMFGWNWWESNAKAGQITVMSFNFGRYLRIAWCLRMMDMLDQMSPEERAQTRLEPAPDLQFWMSDGGPLRGLMNELREASSRKWSWLFGSDMSLLVDSLDAILSSAASEARRRKDDEIIATPVSTALVDQFIASVEESWQATHVLRDLLSESGNYLSSLDTEAPEDSQHLRIDRLYPKEAFIDDPGVMFVGDGGSQFGTAMGNGENTSVIATICAEAGIRHESATDEAKAVEALRASISEMVELGLAPTVIVADAWQAGFAIRNAHGFAPDDGKPGLSGTLDGVPIYHVPSSEHSAIVVADAKHFGEWRQYAPPQLVEDRTIGDGSVRIGVQELTEDEAKAILKLQPDMFADLDSAERPVALQKCVRVRVGESFAFAVRDPSAAIVIDIGRDDAG